MCRRLDLFCTWTPESAPEIDHLQWLQDETNSENSKQIGVANSMQKQRYLRLQERWRSLPQILQSSSNQEMCYAEEDLELAIVEVNFSENLSTLNL